MLLYDKVIGIGAQKTGTTTLGHCLRIWGFNHCTMTPYLKDDSDDSVVDKLLEYADNYESFDDFPWNLMYKEMDQKFDDCIFILTKRKDLDDWYNSLQNHRTDMESGAYFREFLSKFKQDDEDQSKEEKPKVEKTNIMRAFESHIFNESFVIDKETAIKFYEDHIKEVKEYFKDRPECLLEVCWEDGDGWEKLSEFLNLPIPKDMPFPHANRRRKQ